VAPARNGMGHEQQNRQDRIAVVATARADGKTTCKTKSRQICYTTDTVRVKEDRSQHGNGPWLANPEC